MRFSRDPGVPLLQGVTRDDVVWCYRALLGREPESEAAITAHRQVGDFRALVQTFVDSAEFAQRPAQRAFHPMPLPPARIDVDVDGTQMAAAIAKVKLAWAHLGDTRAHHSVLTNEAFLPHALDRSIDRFWASGMSESEQAIAMLARHGFSPVGKVCVEYGCGVGRVTSGLAGSFSNVYGYDISPGHLALAAQRVASLGLDNVCLIQCSDTFLEDLQPCDAFYSRIVFQHNPPPVMHALVRAALTALKPGGIAIFQLPVYAAGYSFDLQAWLSSPPVLDMEMHCLPQPHVFGAVAAKGCVCLEVREDNSVGESRFISNTFVVRRP